MMKPSVGYVEAVPFINGSPIPWHFGQIGVLLHINSIMHIVQNMCVCVCVRERERESERGR